MHVCSFVLRQNARLLELYLLLLRRLELLHQLVVCLILVRDS